MDNLLEYEGIWRKNLFGWPSRSRWKKYGGRIMKVLLLELLGMEKGISPCSEHCRVTCRSPWPNKEPIRIPSTIALTNLSISTLMYKYSSWGLPLMTNQSFEQHTKAKIEGYLQ
jgi:hypothetical protein